MQLEEPIEIWLEQQGEGESCLKIDGSMHWKPLHKMGNSLKATIYQMINSSSLYIYQYLVSYSY